MNSANLQLEGLYLAFAAVNNALVEKGLLTREEIDLALHRLSKRRSGTIELRTYALQTGMPLPSPRAGLGSPTTPPVTGFTPPFSELAKAVGQTKGPYNDQQ